MPKPRMSTACDPATPPFISLRRVLTSAMTPMSFQSLAVNTGPRPRPVAPGRASRAARGSGAARAPACPPLEAPRPEVRLPEVPPAPARPAAGAAPGPPAPRPGPPRAGAFGSGGGGA